jgi:hypothetical protein
MTPVPGLQMYGEALNAWPSAARGLEPRRFQRGPEHTVNFPVHERLPIVRNEETVTRHAAPLDGIR